MMNLLTVHVVKTSKNITLSVLNRNFHVTSAFCSHTFYDVLQIPSSATQSEIKDAYYKLSKIYHPDVKKDENSLAMFRKITEAYDILGNVRTRLEYDNANLGKYTSYDTSKAEFYATLYRDQVLDGVRKPDINKILNTKPLIDKYMDSEYQDRLAEYRMYKNQSYETYVEPFGKGGYTRVGFIFGVCFVVWTYRLCEWTNGW